MANLRGRIFDFERLTLFTEGPEKSRRARMQFGARDGYPRVTVFTGAQGKDGIIQGPMDNSTWGAYLQLLTEVAKGNPGSKYKIPLKTTVFENNKPVYVQGDNGQEAKTQLISDLWVGKDDNGVVWTGLSKENYPKLRFEFMLSQCNEILDGSGNPFTKAKGSVITALAFADLFKRVFATYLLELSKEARETGGAASGSMTNSPVLEELTY